MLKDTQNYCVFQASQELLMLCAVSLLIVIVRLVILDIHDLHDKHFSLARNFHKGSLVLFFCLPAFLTLSFHFVIISCTAIRTDQAKNEE